MIEYEIEVKNKEFSNKNKSDFYKEIEYLNKIQDNLNDMNQLEIFYLQCKIQELISICKYYKLKTNNKSKIDLINDIIQFENETSNLDIVAKRKKIWKYYWTLKNDEFMKDYVLNLDSQVIDKDIHEHIH